MKHSVSKLALVFAGTSFLFVGLSAEASLSGNMKEDKTKIHMEEKVVHQRYVRLCSLAAEYKDFDVRREFRLDAIQAEVTRMNTTFSGMELALLRTSVSMGLSPLAADQRKFEILMDDVHALLRSRMNPEFLAAENLGSMITEFATAEVHNEKMYVRFSWDLVTDSMVAIVIDAKIYNTNQNEELRPRHYESIRVTPRRIYVGAGLDFMVDRQTDLESIERVNEGDPKFCLNAEAHTK